MTSADRFQGLSLRSQLLLASLLMMALVVGATTGLSLWALHQDVRRGVAEVQQTVVDNLARDLDERIELRRNALMQHAVQLGADHLPSPQLLDDYVSGRPLLRDLFDNLIVLDNERRVVFDWPQIPGRRGSRGPAPGVASTQLEEPRGAVLGPYPARASDTSVIAFAVPMYSPAQKRIGTLVGVLLLNKGNFLSQVGKMHLGLHGHFMLSTQGPAPVIVMHPDARLIRQPLTHATASDGGHLVSVKPLMSLPWTLSGHFPTEEAYAPLWKRERDIAFGGVLLILSGGLALWLFIGWLLRPLEALREAMQVQTVSPGQPLPALVARSQELTSTVQAFDALMRSRALAETALRASEERIRSILTHAPDAFVCVDSQGLIIEWNRQAEAMLGWGRDEALQQPLIDLILPPALHPRMNAALAAFASTGRSGNLGARNEFEAKGKHGRVVPVEVSAAALRTPDGHQAILFLRDISERLRAQAQLAASERDLRTITDGLPAMIGYIDSGHRYRFANAYYRTGFGIDPAAMIGRHPREVLGEAAFAQLQGPMAAALRGERQRFDVALDGHGDFHVEYTPDVGADGQVKGFYLMALDIQARKQAERELAESERRMRTLADNMPALITYIDRDQRYRFCNATFLEWTDLDPAEAIGQLVRDAVGEKRYAQRRAFIERALKGERVSFELQSESKADERFLNTVYIPHRDVHGAVAGIYTMSTDVTTMKQVERQLQAMARFDALTGLPNRRQFEERLPEAMQRCRRSGRPMALMFLDMDRLKMINDTHGHAGGDAVLRELAQRLAASVRATDTVARLAGDEFVVILEGLSSADEAQHVARKVLGSLRHPFLLDGASILMTASIGVVFHAGDAVLTPDELIAKADQALYQVKGSGRNAYRLVPC